MLIADGANFLYAAVDGIIGDMDSINPVVVVTITVTITTTSIIHVVADDDVGVLHADGTDDNDARGHTGIVLAAVVVDFVVVVVCGAFDVHRFSVDAGFGLGILELLLVMGSMVLVLCVLLVSMLLVVWLMMGSFLFPIL